MSGSKETEQKIAALIAGDLAAAGYELVRVQLTSGGRFVTLQVMAERQDAKPMTVEDCARISHAVSAKLEAEDPQAADYTLEVSSPGIDRPLVRVKDFERFTGHMARVELEAPLGGTNQRRFQGSIVRVTQSTADAEVELKTEDGDVRVPLTAIARARLVMTDALLKNAQTKH